MTQEHPITPPPELMEQWIDSTRSDDCIGSYPDDFVQRVAIQSARWGADQELEACCEWFLKEGWNSEHPTNLRAARRPKLPSLKAQALALISHDPENQPFLSERGIAIIRRALESLPD